MDSVEYTKRLLSYRLSLLHLKEAGLQNVYSYLLAKETGYSAALVRKDFSRLRVEGKRRGGYRIDHILSMINDYYGAQDIKKIVLAGMGNIGSAIAQYRGFEEDQMRIVAGFDIDPSKYRKKFSIPVYPIDRCREIIENQKIDVAIIAVPAVSAQAVCDQLIQCGITGIMNFAPVNLKVPPHIYVSNIRLSDELQNVIYHSIRKK
jgi:redox-sensing transcriptional repressor